VHREGSLKWPRQDSGSHPGKAFKKVKGAGGKKRSAVTTVTRDIKDILRCTLVFDDFSDLASGYDKVVRELDQYKKQGGIVTGIFKMESGFGAGAEQASGYRDAKLIFRVEAPPDVKDQLEGMMGKLPELSIEVQFNAAAALAVKDGKPPGAKEKKVDKDGNVIKDEWDFELKAGPIGEVFDAHSFLMKLITDRAADPGFVGDVEEFLTTHADTLRRGLPIAHHLYEPKKLAKIAKYEGISTDEVEARYNPLYQKLYEFAFRYSKFKPDTGQKFHDTVKDLRRAHVT
jgi:hypothetical protein